MTPLDKAALLAALTPTITDTEVEGFGAVRLRQVSVAESDRLRSVTKDAKTPDFGLQLIIASMVDADGAPLLTADDLPTLQSASDMKIAKLVERVLEVNGYKAAASPNVAS